MVVAYCAWTMQAVLYWYWYHTHTSKRVPSIAKFIGSCALQSLNHRAAWLAWCNCLPIRQNAPCPIDSKILRLLRIAVFYVCYLQQSGRDQVCESGWGVSLFCALSLHVHHTTYLPRHVTTYLVDTAMGEGSLSSVLSLYMYIIPHT